MDGTSAPAAVKISGATGSEEAAEAAPNLRTLASLLLEEGLGAYRQGRPEDALGPLEEAVDTFAATGSARRSDALGG